MCFYVQEVPLCGHESQILWSYSFCNTLLAQLMRINDISAWQPETVDMVPFNLPDECDPNPGNIIRIYTQDYCGWECRNSHTIAGLGMPDADYGRERVGIVMEIP